PWPGCCCQKTFAVSAGSPGSALPLSWRSTKATIVSTPTLWPRSMKAAFPSARVVNDEVVAAALAPSRMKRTSAPANGCPNWSVTVATRIWFAPATARVCLGARVTVVATGVCQVTVTELEAGAGGADAVTTDVPVMEPDPTVTVAVMEDWPVAEELKEKAAAPELSVVRLPDVAPGPVTVKPTVAPGTGPPWRSNTVATTLAVWPEEL